MDVWTPAEGEDELLDWWKPLLIVARRLHDVEFPWPVHIEEFALRGRVDRGAKPSIWLYQHRTAGGFFNVDDEGRTYRFIPYRRGPSRGRFEACPSRDAAWAAGLPTVHEPEGSALPPAAGAPYEAPVAGAAPTPRGQARSARPRRYGIRRRGHLQLVR